LPLPPRRHQVMSRRTGQAQNLRRPNFPLTMLYKQVRDNVEAL
jgi:hypothetical protein